MKAARVSCVCALWALSALAVPDPNELTFEVVTGQDVRKEVDRGQPGGQHGFDDQQRGPDTQPAQLVFSSPDAQSPKDLFQLSLSLLDELTAHAPPPPPTPYSPHLVSTTSPLDDLEARLEGTVTGSVFRAVRSRVGALYGGKRKPAGGRDYSVRGAVQALRGAVESFAVDKVARAGKSKGPRGASPDGKGWKERLAGAKLKEAVVLEAQEVEEGLREVVELAREAADKGSVEALEFLGDLHLTGHLSLAANATEALAYYTRASELHGSPEAQYKLGFLYGSSFGGGTGDLEGRGQQGSALLHYTFSALAGHVPASMTVGYRHWAGIGTKQSCKDALPWYKAAADAAVKAFNAGPPGGRHLPPPKIRLSDLNGGVYGPGASSARSSLITGGSNAQTQQEWDDLVEYHLFHAERGDAIFMYRLGKLYYQGFGAGGLGGVRYQPRGRLAVALPAGGIPHDELWDGGRDFRRAHKWFLRLARKLWPADGREATWNPAWGPVGKGVRAGDAPRVGFYDAARDKRLEKVDDHTAMLAGLGAGSLGKMYLRGEGVAANYAKAFLWFQRGSKQGDRESNNGLGLMYRDGLGVERDLKKALQLFHAAAQLDLAEAQVNLGKYHFGAGDYALATTYFEAAIRVDGTRWPDVFQAYYYLAELSARSATAAESCPVAVSFYKRVAECGDWDHEVWWEAERARERGDRRTALLGYWIMAERGYEAAQNNVASILDRDTQRYRLPLLDPVAPKTSPATKQLDRLALTYWTRSAAQDNVDALVKAGDYYYKGLGTEDGVPQMEKAASCYQSAATSRISAMSMWNLGWMHETGQGVPKDFHLAKRHYDLAYDTSLDAGFPTTLSLIGLYARALYHAVFVGGDDELNALSLFGRDPDPDAVAGGGEQYGSLWSFGRMWRDIQRNWGYDPGPEPDAVPLHQEHEGQEHPGGEEGRAFERLGGGGGAEAGQQDMRAAQRAFEEAERFDDWREYHDGRGGLGRRHDGGDEDDEYWGDEEGDFGGTVAIVMLCMILAWLLYFRQQPQQQDRQPAPPVPAAAPLAHAQQPAQPQQTPAPTPTQPAPPERPRRDEDEENDGRNR